MSPIASRGLKSIGSRSNFPASILETSRMSLMTVNSASADDLTIRRYSRCSGGELGVQHQIGHPDDAVHRGPDLVAHVGEKLALGPVRGFGNVFGGPQALLARAQRLLGLPPGGGIPAHHPAGRPQDQNGPDDAQCQHDRGPACGCDRQPRDARRASAPPRRASQSSRLRTSAISRRLSPLATRSDAARRPAS